MAKVKLPSWLLEVAGSLSKMDLTFRRFKGRQILETLPAPSYTRSEKQDQQRNKFTQAVKLWHSMTEEEKEPYREIARQLGITPYNAFLREKLKAEEVGIWYKITIDNTGSALTDYQILLNISGDDTFFSDCESKKEAIRVYDTDKATELSYWIEEWDTTNNNAKIWIKVPSIPASGTKTIYMSIDPSRTEDASNGDATFIFFDDFEGTSLDTSKWNTNIGSGGSITVSGGEVDLYAPSSSGRTEIYTKTSIDKPCIIEFKVRDGNQTNSDYYSGVSLPRAPWVESHWFAVMRQRYAGGGSYPNLVLRGSSSGETSIVHKYWNNTHVKFTIKDNYHADYWDDEGDTYSDRDFSSDGITFPSTVSLFSNNAGTQAHAYFDFIFIRKYADPEPTVSYEKE